MSTQHTPGLDKMSKVIQEEKIVNHFVMKKSWFLNKIQKKTWNGKAPYECPMKLSPAGSISAGCVHDDDPWKGKFEKGQITGLGRFTGTLCLSSKELECYNKIDKESYVKLVGNDVQDLGERMVQNVDSILVNSSVSDVIANPHVTVGGAAAGTITAGDALGNLYVRNPYVFSCGHKYEVYSDSQGALTVFVTSVDAAQQKITFQTNKVEDGVAAVPADLSAYDTAAERVLIRTFGYTAELAKGNTVGDLHECLFGDGDLHGLPRSISPYMKGLDYDISAGITPANVLDRIYKKYFEIHEQCHKVGFREALVPYKLYYVLVSELQRSKEYVQRDSKVSYGFQTVCMDGPFGELRFTPIPHMPEDEMLFIDFSSLMWLGSSSYFNPAAPSGNPGWHVERRSDCYVYFRDIYFKGRLICKSPGMNARIKLGPASIYAAC